MNIVPLKYIIPYAICICCALTAFSTVNVQVRNEVAIDRNDEIVEMSLDSIIRLCGKKFRIISSEQKEVGYQITHDRKIIFPANVGANSSVTYTITSGTPKISPDTFAIGAYYAERVDDIAWENDHCGYRLYGPASGANGDKLYGYDIFTKRGTDKPVLPHRYGLELDKGIKAEMERLHKSGEHHKADSIWRSISYHLDHGTGMDVYTVGPTLGAGCTALMKSDTSLEYSRTYNKFEILDNGPLRFTVKLYFAPTEYNGDTIEEIRTLSIDKGSYFNRCEVKYAGLTDPSLVASGIVVHKQNPDGFTLSRNGYVAYADSTDHSDRGNGVIYIGAIPMDKTASVMYQPLKTQVADALGHVLNVSTLNPDDTYVYWWGAVWNKHGVNHEQWIDIMDRSAITLRNPLQVCITK